ncbi:MAG: DEAD/DEAH box helicase [Dehalococcoidia bacterium]
MPDLNKDSGTNSDSSGGRRKQGIIRRTLSSFVTRDRNSNSVETPRSGESAVSHTDRLETETHQRVPRNENDAPAPSRRRSRGGRGRRSGNGDQVAGERADSSQQEMEPLSEDKPSRERRSRRQDSQVVSRSERKPRSRRDQHGDAAPKGSRGGRGRPQGRSSSSRDSGRKSQAPRRIDERAPLENTGSSLQNYDGPPRGKFGDIELSGPIAAALADMGYETPSSIQLEAVPGCLEGRDLVGQAITGSGKTAAFSIPICERVDPYSRDVQAIVLVPTRELAMQVAREVERIGKYRGISVCAVYGGQPINRQLAALQRGVNVVVGTPGRVMDHMGRGTLDLQNVRVAVLDEADEMLDIGFAEDMEFILRHTPRSRQTLLFSATVPGFVKRLIRRYQDDPMWIQLGAEIQTVDEVDQIYFEVAERDKQTALRLVLDDTADDYRMLVFRRTQIGVDRLANALKSRGFGAMGLHGGLSQGERNQAMGMFRAGELPILVSTNVAARGIDIPEITHVVNYDMPDNVEEYVHRIGRTARMGRRGYAITFMAEWDYEGWEKIRSHIGDDKLIQGKLPIYD